MDDVGVLSSNIFFFDSLENLLVAILPRKEIVDVEERGMLCDKQRVDRPAENRKPLVAGGHSGKAEKCFIQICEKGLEFLLRVVRHEVNGNGVRDVDINAVIHAVGRNSVKDGFGKVALGIKKRYPFALGDVLGNHVFEESGFAPATYT